MRHEYETKLEGQQLAGFAAVIEFGSFDSAAERLLVTPSAPSQRIKALEQRVGQVLVVRQKLCRATAAGVPLLRLAAQTAMLESEALAETGGGSAERTRIAIAVNADSMSTWFTAVLGQLPDVLVDIRIEDRCGASAVAGTLARHFHRTEAEDYLPVRRAAPPSRAKVGSTAARQPAVSVSPNTPAQAAAAVAVA